MKVSMCYDNQTRRLVNKNIKLWKKAYTELLKVCKKEWYDFDNDDKLVLRKNSIELRKASKAPSLYFKGATNGVVLEGSDNGLSKSV